MNQNQSKIILIFIISIVFNNSCLLFAEKIILKKKFVYNSYSIKINDLCNQFNDSSTDKIIKTSNNLDFKTQIINKEIPKDLQTIYSDIFKVYYQKDGTTDVILEINIIRIRQEIIKSKESFDKQSPEWEKTNLGYETKNHADPALFTYLAESELQIKIINKSTNDVIFCNNGNSKQTEVKSNNNLGLLNNLYYSVLIESFKKALTK